MHYYERKIAATFGSHREAAEARKQLVDDAGIPLARCEIVVPGEGLNLKDARRESLRTRRSLIFWHVLLGTAGCAAGIGAALAAGTLAPEFARTATPVMYFVAAAIGGMLGLLLAGGISLRPDQNWLYSKVRDRLRQQEWAVIVHPRHDLDARAARDILLPAANEGQATL